MEKYFDIFFEFNHKKFYSKVEDNIKKNLKGYVCVIDANVLTIAHRALSYQNILNNAMINTCDGSSIAFLASSIHNKSFKALNGPEIFNYYIEKGYRQILLGCNVETNNRIKKKIQNKNLDVHEIYHIELPFSEVSEFDYQNIAHDINKIKPDIIWVFLGAPKQEIFMNKIIPFLNQGVLFGIGAAFNFYVGDLKIPKIQFGGLKFIWWNRIRKEPIKLIKRLIPYLILIPKLYYIEMRKKYGKKEEQH